MESDIESISTISSIIEEMYDMSLIQEYDFLFGSPLNHELDEILINVYKINMLKEEIIILLQEIVVLYYKNMSENQDIEEIKKNLIKIKNIINVKHELTRKNT
jgi:hypothetical protein